MQFKVQTVPPMLGLILVILLLLMSIVPNRLRYGTFSSLTISLSDKSIVSNWSCRKIHCKFMNTRMKFFYNWSIYKERIIIIYTFKYKGKLKGRKIKFCTSVAPKFSITAILLPLRSNSRSLIVLKKWGLFQIKSAVSLTMTSTHSEYKRNR